MSVALLSVWIVALASPGPDVLLVLRNAARSRSLAVATACGVVVGLAAWIAIAQIGFATFLSSRPVVKVAFQLAGGGFLLVLGVQALMSTLRQRRDLSAEATTLTRAISMNKAKGFVTGLLTNIANPKALVFFGALFVQFLPTQISWQEQLVVSLTMLGLALAWFMSVALAATHPTILGRFSKNVHIVDAVSSIIFTALGVALLAEGIAAL